MRHLHVILWISVLLLVACASNPKPTVIEYFDEATVTHISRSRKAVDFVARRGNISTHGGDVISMGPVYAAFSAEQDHYLWLGFWTTLDRFRLQTEPPGPPDTVVLDVDGEQLALQRRSLYAASARSASRVYPAPSPGVVDAYYAVTLQQLDRLRAARVVRIRIVEDGDRTIVYEAQDSTTAMFESFIESTG